MALAVPLSRFTSRVGGGSAFYVRHHAHAFTIMKNTLAFITLSLLLTACGHRDAQISHQVVGVWQVGTNRVTTFNSDGSFVTRTSDTRGTNDYTGTWQVQDGYMMLVLTNTSDPKPGAQVGDTKRFQIVSADAHHIAWKVGGQTITISR